MSTRTQIWRFGLVGIAATLIHVISALLLHGKFGLAPLSANFFAFIFAWTTSYLGHYRWTFERQSEHKSSVPKFIFISVTGLGLNQLIVWLIADIMNGSFKLALSFVVIVVPTISFILSKFWAFRKTPAK